MSESDRALTVKDVAQFLEMSTSGASGVLQLMEVFKIVQKVKRGKTYYVLKDVYDEEQISAMLPPERVAPIHRRQRHSSRASPPPADDSLEKYLSAMRLRASSGEGLSALVMLDLTQQETAEENIPTEELPGDLELDIGFEERKFKTPLKSEPFGTVKYLPKDVRRLTRGQTNYLEEQLKFLDGYQWISGFKTVFSKFSALENKKYGNTLYFSMGTNPWDHVKKVTIDPSISDFMFLPTIELKRWSSWNQFLMGLKETREKYGKEEYDKIIDQFMECEHKLVEITVKDRKANYVSNILNKRIGERGLEEQVKTSHVDKWVYLEKVE